MTDIDLTPQELIDKYEERRKETRAGLRDFVNFLFPDWEMRDLPKSAKTKLPIYCKHCGEPAADLYSVAEIKALKQRNRRPPDCECRKRDRIRKELQKVLSSEWTIINAALNTTAPNSIGCRNCSNTREVGLQQLRNERKRSGADKLHCARCALRDRRAEKSPRHAESWLDVKSESS